MFYFYVAPVGSRIVRPVFGHGSIAIRLGFRLKEYGAKILKEACFESDEPNSDAVIGSFNRLPANLLVIFTAEKSSAINILEQMRGPDWKGDSPICSDEGRPNWVFKKVWLLDDQDKLKFRRALREIINSREDLLLNQEALYAVSKAVAKCY